MKYFIDQMQAIEAKILTLKVKTMDIQIAACLLRKFQRKSVFRSFIEIVINRYYRSMATSNTPHNLPESASLEK